MRKSVREYYAEVSKKYDAERTKGYHKAIAASNIELLKKHCAGKKVLEVGCGTGLMMEALKDVADEIVGIDVTPEMLEHAKAKGLNVLQADAENLPFDVDSFDVVFSLKVLPHVGDVDKALHEIRRVCKPFGTVIVEFYNKTSIKYLTDKFQTMYKDRAVCAFFTLRELTKKLQNIFGETYYEIKYHRLIGPLAILYKLPVFAQFFMSADKVLSRTYLRHYAGFFTFAMRNEK